MVEQVHLPKILQERIVRSLESCDDECCGFLMGRWLDDALVIVGSFHCADTGADEVKHAMKEAAGHFSGGISVCGMYFSHSTNTDEDAIMRNVRQTFAAIKESLLVGNVLVCVYQSGLRRRLVENAFWYHVESRETHCVEHISSQQADLGFAQNMVMFRLQTTCHVIVPYSKDSDEVKRALGTELALQIDSVTSTRTAYHVVNSRVLLHNHDDDEQTNRKFCGIGPEQPCSAIFQRIDDAADTGNELKTKRKIKDYSQEIINVQVLKCTTPRNDQEKSAFLIYVDEEPASYLRVPLAVDCVVVADCTEPVGNLPKLFTETITNQLASMGRCMCQFYEDKKLTTPKVVHIKPLGLDHLVTLYIPAGYTDDDLVDLRRSLHPKLHLPLDRPLLRLSNRYLFPDERGRLVYLQNTHLGLPKSGARDGVVSCVQGVYSYHHYMQDNINDNGWGCAYRSLQTIVSWFRHQGYTQVPVPTHKQIQQALVDVGDKQASFVGSRQWIGSTEVGFCLDHLLKVTSKFMFVSAGRELADKGRELAQHFQQQGTPIMIGGGVLAHTILGVDFNEQTGDLKFLILDPHYTGPEDLKEIQSKGWCGWKGPDFWDQNAFYNLCMPQRPSLI